MIVHIKICKVGAMTSDGFVHLEREALASQTLVAAGTSAIASPPTAVGHYFAIVTTDTNVWYNYGTGTPQASADPRSFLLGGGPPTALPWAPGVNFTFSAT